MRERANIFFVRQCATTHFEPGKRTGQCTDTDCVATNTDLPTVATNADFIALNMRSRFSFDRCACVRIFILNTSGVTTGWAK
jgi:hypothetical protein